MARQDNGDIKEYRIKESAWTKMDDLGGTKAGKVHYGLNCKKDIVHLACLIYKVKDLGAFFG